MNCFGRRHKNFTIFINGMKKIIVLLLLLGSFSFIPPKKGRTWTAIGDSITAQDDKPESTKNRITRGYMSRVAEKLPYLHYNNVGRGGWTSKNMADNINSLGIGKTDFYSVFLGTNDWWTALPIGTFADYRDNKGNNTVYGAYRTIIDKIQSLNPDAVIILITPMQRTDFVDVNNSSSIIYGSYRPKNGHFLAEYAGAIKNIAKAENFELVDLYYKSGITPGNAVKYRRLKDPVSREYKNYKYPDYIGMPFNPATDDYPYPLASIDMTYDGLHPSDKGHARIAEMLVKVFIKH
jgi:lysophospholipase L1-like esterase